VEARKEILDSEITSSFSMTEDKYFSLKWLGEVPASAGMTSRVGMLISEQALSCRMFQDCFVPRNDVTGRWSFEGATTGNL